MSERLNWTELNVNVELNIYSFWFCMSFFKYFKPMPFIFSWSLTCFETSKVRVCVCMCAESLQSCPTLCDPMDCSTPGFPVHHQLPQLAQTHVHWVGDAIQSFHPLSPLSPPAFNLSQHLGLFQWVSSLYQMAKVLEFQLHHQSLQWIFMTTGKTTHDY